MIHHILDREYHQRKFAIHNEEFAELISNEEKKD